MKTFDPRVMRIEPARGLLTWLAVLRAAEAALVLLQALLIARLLAPALSPTPLLGDGLGALGAIVPTRAREASVGLPLLVLAISLRAALVWGSERLAHRAGARVVSSLRSEIAGHVGRLGPRWLASGRAPETTVLATRGLDALLPYFTRYLPSLLTAAMVTPLAVIVVAGLDLGSAAIVLVTLPLVPIFMALIGRLTETHARRHLESMMRLGSATLDLVAGLPTLKALGRSRGPVGRVRELGDAHRRATLGSLRIAFLSGMVLELVTNLSVALVAVSMGFRLAAGGVTIETALAVLVLAPEAYLPLRNIGLHFHASTAGLAAVDEAFRFLDLPSPSARGTRPAPDLVGCSILLTGLSVATPDGSNLAPCSLDLEAPPGKVTALVGPNGVGKSTALLALAGLEYPTEGRIGARTADGEETLLADERGNGVVPDGWSLQCAWVPQRPDCGPEGHSLSLGQRQTIAVGTAVRSHRAVVLLDEPTAHLDPDSRREIVRSIRGIADEGAVVVVATQDAAVVAAADRVVEVSKRGGP